MNEWNQDTMIIDIYDESGMGFFPMIFTKSAGKPCAKRRTLPLMDLEDLDKIRAIMRGDPVTLTDKDMNIFFKKLFEKKKALLGTKTTFIADATCGCADGSGKIPVAQRKIYKISDGKDTIYLPLPENIDVKCKQFSVERDSAWKSGEELVYGPGVYTDYYPRVPFRRLTERERSTQEKHRNWLRKMLTIDNETERSARRSPVTFPGYVYGDVKEDVSGFIIQDYQDKHYYSPLAFMPEDPRAKALREGKLVLLTSADMDAFFDREGHFLASENSFKDKQFGPPKISEDNVLYHVTRDIKGKIERVSMILPKNVVFQPDPRSNYKVSTGGGYASEFIDVVEKEPTQVPSALRRIHQAWNRYYWARHAREAAHGKSVGQTLRVLRNTSKSKDPVKKRAQMRAQITMMRTGKEPK